MALHPMRDEYAIVIDGAKGGHGVGAIQVVGGWESKNSNMCTSHVTYLHAGAMCCDYSVDGSVICVGLTTGQVVFISSQTASKVHTVLVATSPPATHCQVRKVRFSPCGRLLACVLESRDIVVVRMGDGNFSDDSRALKSVAIAGTGKGHAEVINGIDWSATDSPDVPVHGAFIRTSGACHELIHWRVDSLGCISKVENVGVKVSQLRNVLWHTTSTRVGWEVQGLHTLHSELRYDATCTQHTTHNAQHATHNTLSSGTMQRAHSTQRTTRNTQHTELRYDATHVCCSVCCSVLQTY